MTRANDPHVGRTDAKSVDAKHKRDPSAGARVRGIAKRLMMGVAWVCRTALKAPVHLYRWTLKPFLGHQCRHLPSCSEYALDAIDRNGAWRGGWLAVSRIYRCAPWGSAGYDPAPDIAQTRHRLRPWRYGRWTGAHIDTTWSAPAAAPSRASTASDTTRSR